MLQQKHNRDQITSNMPFSEMMSLPVKAPDKGKLPNAMYTSPGTLNWVKINDKFVNTVASTLKAWFKTSTSYKSCTSSEEYPYAMEKCYDGSTTFKEQICED